MVTLMMAASILAFFIFTVFQTEKVQAQESTSETGKITLNTEEITPETEENTTGNDEETTTASIVERQVEISKCDISLLQTNYTYDGKIKKPVIEVKYGTEVLKNGKDYTVSYSDNKNSGKGKIVIKAIQNSKYKGKVTKQFTIRKASPFLKVSNKLIELNKNNLKTRIKVRSNTDGKIIYKTSNSSIAKVDSYGVITPKKSGICRITVIACGGQNYISKKTTVKVKVIELKEQKINCGNVITKIYGDRDFSLNIKVKDGAKVTYSIGNTDIARVSNKGIVKIKGIGTTKINIKIAGTDNYNPVNKSIVLNVKKIPLNKVKITLREGKKITYDSFDEEKDLVVMYGKRVLKNDRDYFVCGASKTGIGNMIVYLRVEIEATEYSVGTKAVTLIE